VTRTLKSVFRLLAALMAFVVVGIGVETIANFRTQKAADALLREVQRLNVGESTEEDINRIVAELSAESRIEHFNLCGAGVETHRTVIDNGVLNWLGYRAKILRPFGNRVWRVEADFVVDRGKLCFLLYVLRTFDTHYALEITSSSIAEQDSEDTKVVPYEVSVGTRLNIRYVRTETTTQASEEERQHAFDFDLACLSRLRGCSIRCEVVSSARLDYARKTNDNGQFIERRPLRPSLQEPITTSNVA
jgi:hypothetical protein